MPLTRIQELNLKTEIGLVRTITLPRFNLARQRYADGFSTGTVRLKPLGTQVLGETSGYVQRSRNKGVIPFSEAQVTYSDAIFGFNPKIVARRYTPSVLAGHESVHVAQAFEGEMGLDDPNVKYFARPSEQEAFQNQRANADLINQVYKTVDKTVDLDNPLIRTSALLNASRRLVQKALSKDADASQEEGSEINRLTTQVELLADRLETLTDKAEAEPNTDDAARGMQGGGEESDAGGDDAASDVETIL